MICAGGKYLESAFVVIKLLRHYGSNLPIQIWHAGNEIPLWSVPAFEKYHISFHDVMDYTQNRTLEEMRGFPIKTASLLHSSFEDVMLIDADCFPVCNIDFLFTTEEYKKHQAIFFQTANGTTFSKEKLSGIIQRCLTTEIQNLKQVFYYLIRSRAGKKLIS